MTPPTEDNCRRRGAVYRLLAILWAEELTRPALQLLESHDVSQSWISLGGPDPSALGDKLDQLAEDYCRLFVGPTGHLPPIQSVWTAGELQSDVVSSLSEYALVCGYASPWSGLLPDHLANELQLMASTLEKCSLESDPTCIETAHEFAASFFESHLAWTTPFLTRVTERDSGGFYSSLATVTQSFLDSEASNYEPADNDSVPTSR